MLVITRYFSIKTLRKAKGITAGFDTTFFRGKHVLRRNPIRVVNSYEKKTVQSLKSFVDGNTGTVLGKNKYASVDIATPNTVCLPFPRYEKLTEHDPRYTKLLMSLKYENIRKGKNKILLEGVRLINDAVVAGLKLETLLFSKDEVLTKINTVNLEGVQLYKVLYKELKVWSCLDTCPGIMGIFKKPATDDLAVITEPALPVTVICYNIKDHKTMGAVIRNAASAGCRYVIFTTDCIDVWNQKVLRSGCGGHFRIPIVDEVEWTHIANYLKEDSTVYIVDPDTAVGSHLETEKFIDYEEENSSEEEEGENSYVVSDSKGYYMKVNEDYTNPDHLQKYTEDLLWDLPYSDIIYPHDNIVLCVSEKDSIDDPRAVKLACDFGGYKLKIPVQNKVNLNLSVALPVILYEMKRQFVEKYVFK